MSSTEVAGSFETLSVQREDKVLVVALNRPDSLNAINPQLGRELLSLLRETADDPGVRCIVLAGEGRAFSSGADLKEAGGGELPTLASGRPDLGWLLRELYNPLILQMREQPQPIVAAVEGAAAGIGCSFALACDHVVMARSSYFLLAFVNVALVPDGGATVLVPARAGLTRALEMALLGGRVAAEQAVAWSLANELTDDGAAREAAMAVARKLAAGPPGAYAAIKQLHNHTVLPQLREQLALEAEAQSARSDSDEVVEAISAFMQKRAPDYG